MASDVRRFVTFLRDVPKCGSQQEISACDGKFVQRHSTDPGTTRTGATELDYDGTKRLLSKFKDDERVRHVLMQTSDEVLNAALDRVQQQLREVENVSITAYIGEAGSLIDLHGQVKYLLL